MSRTLILEISEDIYAVLKKQARATGTSPEELAASSLRQHYGLEGERTEAEKQAARAHFRRHSGAVSLGYPTGADNERIDADLAREYANGYQEG